MSKTKAFLEPKLKSGIISREEALKLCPDYVAFVEGNFDLFETVMANFSKARHGTQAITASGGYGAPLTFVRVKVASVKSDDIRAVDGPVVRVTNGEYSWRVDGDKYAHIL